MSDTKKRDPLRAFKAGIDRLPGMMTCREADGFIVDYLDGKLPFWTGVRFRFHVLVCAECRRFMARYRRLLPLERASFPDPDALAAEELPEDLVQAILAARRGSG